MAIERRGVFGGINTSRLRRLVLTGVVAGTFGLTLTTGLAQGASASQSNLTAHHVGARDAASSRSVFNRINAIRASFGLASGKATSAYNTEVLTALRSNEDPPFAPLAAGVVGEESLWGIAPGTSTTSSPSPLVVVNGWVYQDGWNGSVRATWNLDCTSAVAPGCNGHRRAVLSTPPVPGAKLFIDVTTQMVQYDGTPALAVAALLVWKTSTSA